MEERNVKVTVQCASFLGGDLLRLNELGKDYPNVRKLEVGETTLVTQLEKQVAKEEVPAINNQVKNNYDDSIIR